MSYTAPPTVAAGDVFTATYVNTYIKDNETYLFSGRPNLPILRDNGANYTTTSTSFADVDSTNVVATLTISSGKVLVYMGGMVSNSGATGLTAFDVSVDGTRHGNSFTRGIWTYRNITTMVFVGGVVEITGLSAGSHTFKLQWRCDDGTSTLRSGSGTGTDDTALLFGVTEMG